MPNPFSTEGRTWNLEQPTLWCKECAAEVKTITIDANSPSAIFLKCGIGHSISFLRATELKLDMSQPITEQLLAHLIRKAPKPPLSADDAYWHACSGTELK